MENEVRRLWEKIYDLEDLVENYKEEASEYKQIVQLMKDGHPYHCACRQTWGDEECECKEYGKGYNPDKWEEVVPNISDLCINGLPHRWVALYGGICHRKCEKCGLMK